MALAMVRAKISLPPPAAACTTNSTGRSGFQLDAGRFGAAAPLSAAITVASGVNVITAATNVQRSTESFMAETPPRLDVSAVLLHGRCQYLPAFRAESTLEGCQSLGTRHSPGPSCVRSSSGQFVSPVREQRTVLR